MRGEEYSQDSEPNRRWNNEGVHRKSQQREGDREN
jgi:hypothetical protein